MLSRAATLTALGDLLNPTPTPDMIAGMRGRRRPHPSKSSWLGHAVTHQERTIPGPDGAPDLIVSIFTRPDHVPGGPGSITRMAVAW